MKEESKILNTKVLILILLAAGVVCTLIGINSKNNNKDSESLGYIEGKDYSNSGITTYQYDSVVLHGDDIDKVTNSIKNTTAHMREVNAYINVQVAENAYDSYVYNKSGEAIAQSSDGSTAVAFKNNGQSIAFGGSTGEIYIGNDADILSLIDSIADVIQMDKDNRNDINVFDMVLDEAEPNIKEYRVEIIGEEIFKEIYKNFGNGELGDSIIETLREQVAEVTETEFVPHFIYIFVVDEVNMNFSAVCQLIVDGTENTNWILDGYIGLNEWKMEDDWYNLDFSQILTEDAFTYMDELLLDIQEVINIYMEENNIEVYEDTETGLSSEEENSINTEETQSESELENSSDNDTESNDAILEGEQNQE